MLPASSWPEESDASPCVPEASVLRPSAQGNGMREEEKNRIIGYSTGWEMTSFKVENKLILLVQLYFNWDRSSGPFCI